MYDVTEAWLKSGQYAEIAGLRLLPVEHPMLTGTSLVVVRGQARAYYLRDDNNLEWILKKFLPGHYPGDNYIRTVQSLIPHQPGFQSGYLRRVLTKEDVSKSGFFTAEFASWVGNTVLMPRILSSDWASLAYRMRSGILTLPNEERLLLCRRLSEKISILENSNLSHRDLSSTNVFTDEKNLLVHLIDWDSIFHPSLGMPPYTTFGTCGYVAPFVAQSSTPDPLTTWRPRSDRFSLAILNSEFLSLNAGSPSEGDGGMFNQDELYARSGSGLIRILGVLKNTFPGADSLLRRALDARSFDDCPSPSEWIALSGGITQPIQFYSCFISYSSKDEEFARRLYSRLRDAGLRVWFAPEDAKGGQKLFEQIDQAIQMHDRLLLVLSESSLQSNWVEKEIRQARAFERKNGRRKLFPIRLTDYETLQQWTCMDTISGEDLADEVRSYFIPDFSTWKSYDDFERAFERLLNDLKLSAELH
jgi:serine/threonine protein kinase